VTPNFNPNGPYDPVNDFEPIGTLGAVPIVLVVNASSPQVVDDLVAAAKSKPGALSYASSGAGGPQHMSAELFASMTGVKMLHVPYKGNVPAVTDLLGGQVDVLFSPINSALPHIKSGRLRALAMASDKRSGRVARRADADGGRRRRVQERNLDRVVRSGPHAEGHCRQAERGDPPHAVAGRHPGAAQRARHRADDDCACPGISMIKTDLARWQTVIKETGLKAN
jgi:hypothetical protein